MWKKIGFGILFVAACFVAMYTLIEHSGNVLYAGIAAAVLLITAFLFFNAIFSDKVKKWIPEEEREEEPVAATVNEGEFRLKIAKYMKEMESTQKELIDVLKNQNKLIQAQIENLEHEIYMLSEKQANQAKSIIKYNKENARQLAISERETLEYVMSELKAAIEKNSISGVMPVLEEVSGAELFEVADFSGDDELVMPEVDSAVAVEETPVVDEIPVTEQVVADEIPVTEQAAAQEIPELIPELEIAQEIPELPEDIDLSELFDIPELQDDPEEAPVEEVPVEEVPVMEAPVEEEKPTEPAPSPLASLAGGDPNAMMTPEDIAKLLESMGQ